MAGKFNTTTSARDMEMFQVFFDKESKRFGNSKEFKALANAFKAYREASLDNYGPEQSVKFSQAAEQLKNACEAYTTDRTGAFTTKGKDRLQTIRQLSSYMPYWSMERAQGELDHAMSLPMNEANADHLVRMNTMFKNQCSAYLSGNETFRKDKVSAVQEAYREKNDGIDRFRDVSMVQSYRGKTFEEIAKEPRAEVKMAKDAEKTGANVSERFQATYNGKRGFFTATNMLNLDKSSYITSVLEEERAAGNMARVETMKNAEGILIDAVDSNTWEKRLVFDSKDNRIALVGANQFLKFWNQLPEGSVKEDLSVLAGDYGKVKNLVDYIQRSVNKHDGAMSPEIFREALMSGVENVYRENDRNQWLVFSKAEMLQDVFAHVEDQRMGLLQNMHAENYLIARKAALYGKPEKKAEMNQIEAVLKDPELVNKIAAAGTKAAAAELAEGAGSLGRSRGAGRGTDLSVEESELTLRSVAMTRVADLLGVGDIIARSERVTMDVDGKKVDGCFMEFAEGVNLDSKDPHVREVIHSIDFKGNPGYYRDAAKIEMLDYLCGQHDRHGSNMFYKLSEPDAEGKRNIIGIQGIDNDLAFGNSERFRSGFQGEIETLVFVDKGMADLVRGLDREKLEYALGDLIPKTQMDAMMARLDKIQTKLKNGDMIELGPDQWDLDLSITDKYPDTQKLTTPNEITKYVEKMGEKGMSKEEQNLLRGALFQNLSASVNLGENYKFLNKSGVIKHKLLEVEKDYQKDMEFASSLGTAMGDMFNNEGPMAGEVDKVMESIPAPAPAPSIVDYGNVKPAVAQFMDQYNKMPDGPKKQVLSGLVKDETALENVIGAAQYKVQIKQELGDKTSLPRLHGICLMEALQEHYTNSKYEATKFYHESGIGSFTSAVYAKEGPTTPAMTTYSVEESNRAMGIISPEEHAKQQQAKREAFLDQIAPGRVKPSEKLRMTFAEMEKTERSAGKRTGIIGAHRQREEVREQKKEDKGRSI